MFKMRFIFSLVVSVLITLAAMAQENVSNIRIQQADHILMILYDLAEQANIEVYASLDGGETYTSSLQHVVGAVGLGVPPGMDKVIAWNVLEEIGSVDIPNFVIKVVASNEVGQKPTQTSFDFFSEGKEITFYYPGRVNRRDRSDMVEMTLDDVLIVTAKLSEGFLVKIKDPTPGRRTIFISAYHVRPDGRKRFSHNFVVLHRVDTSHNNYFELSPDMNLSARRH